MGDGILKAGEKQAWIKTKAVDDNSRIFISIENEIENPLYIAEQKKGEGFWVKTKSAQSNNVSFSWWIVEKK